MSDPPPSGPPGAEPPPSPYEPPRDQSPYAPPPPGQPPYPPQDQSPTWPPPERSPYGPPADDPSPYSQPPYGQPGSHQTGHWAQQPPYAPQGPYAQYGPPPGPARGTNVLAILSLVFAFVFAPAGVVLGHLAKRQIRTSGEDGDQLATWGLILGYVFTGIVLLACCGWLALVIFGNTGRSSGY
ncbi:DUF4190 domain-containing protein [Micromonospora sp. CPCC 205539]|uniref:DUF4190 domain-containing protein n=1 Tax=Micromonospora sp. CPCC 205539 TaxID=3122408 RepID=UPI002FF002FD